MAKRHFGVSAHKVEVLLKPLFNVKRKDRGEIKMKVNVKMVHAMNLS